MTVDLQFNAEQHRYTLNGRIVPSVTQVLDPLNMLDGIPWDVLEAAREFGNHVHTACHLFNLDDLDWNSLDAVLASYVRGYQRFLIETGFVVIASEERVASISCMYAGTLDIRGLLPQRKRKNRALIDIKSTATLPRTVGPQTAAYAHANFEMTGEKSDCRFCLHLKPDDYKLVKLTDGPRIQDFTLFLSALNVHRWRAAV